MDIIKNQVNRKCSKDCKQRNVLSLICFSLISFFWVYLLTGSLFVSLIYLFAGGATEVLKELKESKAARKNLVLSLRILVVIETFLLVLLIGTPTKAWISIVTWCIVYYTYSAKNL